MVSRTLGSTPRPPTPPAAEAVEARDPTGVPARGTTAPQPRMVITAGPGAAAAAAEAVTTGRLEVEAEAGGWWGEEGNKIKLGKK